MDPSLSANAFPYFPEDLGLRLLGDNHHVLIAAALLSPWISEQRSWLLFVHHVELQRVHFANHPAQDAHLRDRYFGHSCFAESTHFYEFCDQNSFASELSDDAAKEICTDQTASFF